MEEQTSANLQNKPDTPTLTKKSSFGKKLIVFLLIIVFALIAGGLLGYKYFIKPMMSENQNLEIALSGLKTNNRSDQKTFQTPQQTVLVKQKAISLKTNNQSNQKTLQALQQTVLTNQKAISNITQHLYQRSNGWTLKEITQLIRLAHLKLQVEYNVPMAIRLLQNADNLLKKLNNSKYQQLRSTLNQDITALEDIKQLKLTNLYLKLQALDTQLQELNLIQPIKPQIITKIPDENQTRWEKSLTLIKQVVVIQKHESTITPLLTGQQISLIKLAIRLHITQAQIALLQRNDLVYQDNLSTIKKLVQHYFSMNTQLLNSWLSQIQTLQEVNLETQTGDIQDSLTALQQTLSSQENLS